MVIIRNVIHFLYVYRVLFLSYISTSKLKKKKNVIHFHVKEKRCKRKKKKENIINPSNYYYYYYNRLRIDYQRPADENLLRSFDDDKI